MKVKLTTEQIERILTVHDEIEVLAYDLGLQKINIIATASDSKSSLYMEDGDKLHIEVSEDGDNVKIAYERNK